MSEKTKRPLCAPLGRIIWNRELSAGLGLIGRGLVGFFHSGLGRLETHLGVRAVAEGLVHRPAAAAQREGYFAGQVVLVAVRVKKFNRSFGRLHAIRPVLAAGNLNLRHVSPPFFPARDAVVSIVAELYCTQTR